MMTAKNRNDDELFNFGTPEFVKKGGCFSCGADMPMNERMLNELAEIRTMLEAMLLHQQKTARMIERRDHVGISILRDPPHSGIA